MIKKIWEKPELNELGVKDTKSASNINLAFKVSRRGNGNGNGNGNDSSSSGSCSSSKDKSNNTK